MVILSQSVEIGVKFHCREVPDCITLAHPRSKFKKTSGHKEHSPIGRYRLRWMNVEERPRPDGTSRAVIRVGVQSILDLALLIRLQSLLTRHRWPFHR